MELVPEKKNLNNLLYIRELIKLDINDWVEDSKNGMIKRREDVIGLVEELSLVEETISGLYSKCELINSIKTA